MKNVLLESIEKMIPNGNRLELPKDEHFANYAAVKKCLLTAGGKYKKCGFEFTEAAVDIQKRLIGGEAINDKKKFQFFATPDHLVDILIERADITIECRVLEPSAGQGAISNKAREIAKECVVVEIAPENIKALNRQEYEVIEGDFLELSREDLGGFDRIIANPPFTKNQDIDHIRHMYNMLNNGGRLVSIASPSWTFGSQKKQIDFREWLDDMEAEFEEIAAGEFKESGTAIRSMLIVIDKPS